LPNNQTPAEAAGIDLKLDKQNPMKDLIVKSAIASQKETNFEGYVIKQLGKRFEKLSVVTERDYIKFKQQGWIEKQEWREINDILRVNGFAWLSNGKDSCWIKMMN
jgi:putative transposase